MIRPFVCLSAQAAIVGGLLRIAASFVSLLAPSNLARQSLYFAVDVCLTVGLVGFWWQGSKDFGASWYVMNAKGSKIDND